MALTVTATQGGSTNNGMLLRVYVLTGAKNVAGQTGNSNSTQFSSATNWTASITNSASSNIYLAAGPEGSSLTLTGSNMTLVDQVSDLTNIETYVTGHATGLSSGTTTRGFTISVFTESGPFVMLEILASGTIAEDGSAPAVVSTTAATTLTTASFTPPAGSLLVALVSSNGSSSGITTMTVSGGSLTWTEAVKNNPSGGLYAGIWIADVPAAAGLVTSAVARGRAAVSRARTMAVAAPVVVLRPAGVTAKPPVPLPPRGRIAVAAGRPARPVPARSQVRAAVSYVQPGRVVVVRSTGAGVIPPAPAAAVVLPSGMLDRRPGYLKKRVLFGI